MHLLVCWFHRKVFGPNQDSLTWNFPLDSRPIACAHTDTGLLSVSALHFPLCRYKSIWGAATGDCCRVSHRHESTHGEWALHSSINSCIICIQVHRSNWNYWLHHWLLDNSPTWIWWMADACYACLRCSMGHTVHESEAISGQWNSLKWFAGTTRHSVNGVQPINMEMTQFAGCECDFCDSPTICIWGDFIIWLLLAYYDIIELNRNRVTDHFHTLYSKVTFFASFRLNRLVPRHTDNDQRESFPKLNSPTFFFTFMSVRQRLLSRRPCWCWRWKFLCEFSNLYSKLNQTVARPQSGGNPLSGTILLNMGGGYSQVVPCAQAISLSRWIWLGWSETRKCIETKERVPA